MNIRSKPNNKLNKKTMAVFFTAGVSLKKWHYIGSLEREIALYNEMSNNFRNIYFFTYGDDDDLQFEKFLAENIVVVPKKYISNNLLYSLLIPFIHYKILKDISILKTNQMWGSWSAILTKILFKNKLIVRTGYILSINFKKQNPKSWKNLLIQFIEKIAYTHADAIITTSQSNLNFINDNYSLNVEPVLITNYIETQIFKPSKGKRKEKSICFVGRLSKVKNLFNLFEALKEHNYSLSIIGSGPLLCDLKKFASTLDLNVNFLGTIPNHKIPQILNTHEIFILPSLWEGMPKSLLEAMACGLPVIGTNVKGINEVIEDGKSGILCDTNPDSISKAIIYLMKDNDLKKKLGKNARKAIVKNYALESLVLKELEIMDKL